MPKTSDHKVSEKKKTGKFRFKGKEIALTYSQISDTRPTADDWKEHIIATMAIKNVEIIGYCISTEPHEEKGWHIHMWLKAKIPMETRSERYWDIMGSHPNIRNIHNTAGWIKYIKKDNMFIELGTPAVKNKDPAWNYTKIKADQRLFDRDKELGDRKDITYPLEIFGFKIEKPDPSNKKRHLWVCASPDYGKSLELNKLGGYKVFKAGPDPHYRFEGHEQEEIIIFDDCDKINRTELISCSDTHTIETRIPGGSRYIREYWKKNQTRIIIVASNNTMEQDPALIARFHQLNL